jgi:5,10-methylenetetrahydromethanopterin reductase
VVCGIGVGDRPLPEIGMQLAKVDTLNRAVALMRRLWDGETLNGRIDDRTYEDARLRGRLEPIPVYYAASGPRTLEAAGEHADGVILLAGLFEEGLAFAREHLERGRERSTRPSFSTTAFLYGAICDDEQRALDAARTIAAWFPMTAPAYARMAGMSDELIEAVVAAYGGGEFQEASAAASLISDDLVRKIAFAGTPDGAREKLDWVRASGVDAMSVFPLGRDRRETIAGFAQMAFGAEAAGVRGAV